MSKTIEQSLTKIFKKLNPHAQCIITAKNENRENTNYQSILKHHNQFEIWYVVNNNYVKVGDIKPHKLGLCTNRLPIEIQIEILKPLYKFTNQPIYKQLTNLGIKFSN